MLLDCWATERLQVRRKERDKDSGCAEDKGVANNSRLMHLHYVRQSQKSALTPDNRGFFFLPHSSQRLQQCCHFEHALYCFQLTFQQYDAVYHLRGQYWCTIDGALTTAGSQN